MRYWRAFLGGLLLWFAHFLAVYVAASLLPGTRLAGIIVFVLTALALGVAAWLASRTLRSSREASDPLADWSSGIALLGYALAAVAIAYQGLPAAFPD